MFRICKTFWVESGHFLLKVHKKSNCRIPHGHSRKVEVVLISNKLDEADMVCDFGAVKAAFEEYLNTFDHAMLINTNSKHYEYFKDNFDRIIPFEGIDPTSEIIAKTLFDYITKQLLEKKVFTNKKGITFTVSGNVKIERVRVWETESCWAEVDCH